MDPATLREEKQQAKLLEEIRSEFSILLAAEAKKESEECSLPSAVPASWQRGRVRFSFEIFFLFRQSYNLF